MPDYLDRPYGCEYCGGTGDCDNCDGYGTDIDGNDCLECDGSGSCPECLGDGEAH